MRIFSKYPWACQSSYNIILSYMLSGDMKCIKCIFRPLKLKSFKKGFYSLGFSRRVTLFLCVCVWMSVWVGQMHACYRGICILTYACGDQRTNQGVHSSGSSLHFFRQDLSMAWSLLDRLGWLLIKTQIYIYIYIYLPVPTSNGLQGHLLSQTFRRVPGTYSNSSCFQGK